MLVGSSPVFFSPQAHVRVLKAFDLGYYGGGHVIRLYSKSTLEYDADRREIRRGKPVFAFWWKRVEIAAHAKKVSALQVSGLSHRGFPLWLMVYLTVPYVCTSMEKWLGPLLKVFGITDGVIIAVM